MSLPRASNFCFAITAVLLGGCAGTPVNPPSGTIAGIPGAKAKVVLREQQEVRVASNATLVFPAGDYRPVFEDENGIYFEAPSKVIMNEKFFGLAQLAGRPYTGGIFLERSNPKVAKTYLIMTGEGEGEIQRYLKAGRPSKPTLPKEPIQFELTKS
jgi:hypothetical protein